MVTFDMNIIGRKIEEARRNAGFSQEVMAEYLGIDQALISRYEQGQRPIAMDYLDKLSDLFQCTIDYFLGIEDANIAMKKIALRGSDISGEDLKTVAKINRIMKNLKEMEQIQKEIEADVK